MRESFCFLLVVFLLFASPPTFPVEKWELNIRKKKKVRKSNTIAFKNNIFSHFQLCQSERKITPSNILL